MKKDRDSTSMKTGKEFVQKCREDKRYRARMMLYAGATVNLLFVGVELYGGIRYRSAWFAALGVYYLVLTIVKLYVGISMKRGNREAEWRKFRLVGCVLLALNAALTVMITVMVAYPEVALHGYSTVVAIALAGWTFFLFISAAVSLRKMRGQDDAMMLASRIISFVAAVVSVLMLQTAMIASFGTYSGDDVVDGVVTMVDDLGEVTGTGWKVDEMVDKTMDFMIHANRATGTAVGLIVFSMTIYMIARGTRENRKRKLG